MRAYAVKGYPLLATNVPAPAFFAQHAGTNLTLNDIAHAASALQRQYRDQGHTNVIIALAPEQISDGIVTLTVFRGRFAQILVSGKQYPDSPGETGRGEEVATTQSIHSEAESADSTRAPQSTNVAPARVAKAISHFQIRAYAIHGETLLSTETLTSIFSKYTGTNITVGDIVKAGEELQLEYRDRGYPTVNVTIPPQQITDGIVRIQVFVGRLAQIEVSGNRYFSSNNVIRAFPSLHENMILNGPIFQAELDRANANQDRQIYPELAPGARTNTTDLLLKVKDRLPLHGRFEANNQSSPGTPDLRLNASAVYNNLWQSEHSLGIQYSFSPEDFKSGDQWDFYDQPLVASYGAFYRLPLGDPPAIADVVASDPGNFGYDEATRKFRLPPSSGRSELTLYGSRSTIDTGLETLNNEEIYNVPGVRQIVREDFQQDLTINGVLGFRLSRPVPEFSGVRSTWSAGLDYKTFDLTSYKTNDFVFSEITINPNGKPNPPVVSTVSSPVPTTRRAVNYIPLVLRWDGSRSDKHGVTTFGLGYTVNLLNRLFDQNKTKFQNVAGSSQANGFYHILNANIGRDQVLYKNWHLAGRADGQWASQPLISNEQFGIGGVAGVRGYRQGEVFGDAGWRVTLELKSPPHVVGTVYGNAALIVRASAFMDYAEAYLLDPNGRDNRVPLWGSGFGIAADVGSHWGTRLLFSVPLLKTTTTTAYEPRFDFALTAQF